MILSTKGRYSVMLMVDIAMNSDLGNVSIEAISKRQNIPVNYLEQLCARLRRAGLLQSIKGPGGGYKLARSYDQITIWEIVKNANEPTAMTRCSTLGKSCIIGHVKCLTHDLWKGLENTIEDYMHNVTLGHIVSSCDHVKVKEECNYVS